MTASRLDDTRRRRAEVSQTCTARIFLDEEPKDFGALVLAALRAKPCGNRATYRDPFTREPICEVCGRKRQAAHEEGSTVLSAFDRARGVETKYVLLPLGEEESSP
jgi:hypothetical protein